MLSPRLAKLQVYASRKGVAMTAVDFAMALAVKALGQSQVSGCLRHAAT